MIYNPYFEHARHQRRGGADGLPGRRTTRRSCGGVPADEHPRRADHHAAQGDDRRRCSTRSRPTVRIAGACNAVRRGADGRLVGDMFDGEGFVRGVRARAARSPARGCWWSAAAASARRSPRRWPRPAWPRSALFDAQRRAAEASARRLRAALPGAAGAAPARNDPAGYDVVVNATPLGMNEGDPLPMDVARIAPVDLRRRGGDEEGDDAVPRRRAGHGAAASRSAPTCCSSRSRPTWNSSACRRPPPRNCAVPRAHLNERPWTSRCPA